MGMKFSWHIAFRQKQKGRRGRRNRGPGRKKGVVWERRRTAKVLNLASKERAARNKKKREPAEKKGKGKKGSARNAN